MTKCWMGDAGLPSILRFFRVWDPKSFLANGHPVYGVPVYGVPVYGVPVYGAPVYVHQKKSANWLTFIFLPLGNLGTCFNNL